MTISELRAPLGDPPTGSYPGDRGSEIMRLVDAQREARTARESLDQRELGFSQEAEFAASRPPIQLQPSDALRSSVVLNQNASENKIPANTEIDSLSGAAKFLQSLSEIWRLSESDLLVLLGFETGGPNQLREFLHSDFNQWSRDQKERVADLVEIRATLDALLQDIDAENKWLRHPRAGLDGRSPLDLMLSGSMENLIDAKYFSRAVAGR